MRETWLLISLLILFNACQKESEPHDAKEDFRLVPSSESGIDFSNNLFYKPDLNIVEYLYYYNGSGVAIGDINNDGLEDIYMGANQLSDRLYLNKGGMQFEDITSAAGLLMDSTWTNGINMDDVDNDGDLDIYVCKLGNHNSSQSHNYLYINNGDLTFTEKSEELGLDFKGYSTQAVFLDYDLDDDLDVYIVNHNVHSIRSYGDIKKRMIKDSLAGDLFFENRLNSDEGKFVDVTDEVGIYSSALGYGLSVVSTDVNNDGWPDIYVGNDFHENDYLYINQRDGTFEESIKAYTAHTSKFTMGIDAKDINNDGLADIFTTDMLPRDKEIFLSSAGEETDQLQGIKRDFGFHTQYARNHLLVNQGGSQFADMALIGKTYASDWTWSVLIQDFDNDASQDFFITNGIVKRPNNLDYINYVNQIDFTSFEEHQKDQERRKMIDQMPEIRISNLMASRNGPQKWKYDVDELGLPAFSNGAAYSDLDLDGDLDLVVNNINQEAFLMENIGEAGNFISIQLEGINEFYNTKGSKVTVFNNGLPQTIEKQTTRGFLSSSTHKLHFGLGQRTKVDSIQVTWPDGKRQVVNDSEVNQHLIISRSDGLSSTNSIISPIQESEIQVFQYKHVENAYEDYKGEALIPQKLSREGPAMILEDLNNDGEMDLFIGGAHLESPQLYMGEGEGQFTRREVSHFRRDAKYEDVDAATLDFNGDGYKDIYVVSGGGQYKVLDKNLEDRLYLNDGEGNFIRWPLSLPHTNGATVSIADYDKDGRDDIFVGARSIPKSYGLSPFSYLLRNVAGQYVEVEFKSRLGMVTSSEWADINNDSLDDLVVVGDWMPVSVLMQKDTGGFINMTEEWGLGDTHGMWNTVACEDINSDGVIDIIAGNMGLNSKWSASSDMPMHLYLDDFDGNGQVDPIIYFNYFNEMIPFASPDMLMGQIPGLRKKFPSYNGFTKINSIQDLTGKQAVDMLEVKSVKELRSMIYLNSGDSFRSTPLPQEAQMSPIQDFAVRPGAKKKEILYVGNFKDNLALLGESSSNSGGLISDFDPNNSQFTKHSSLGLPQGMNNRRIIPLDNGSFVISANDDYLYLLRL